MFIVVLKCGVPSRLGADPELRTGDGWTALHCAAFWSNYEVVGLLLTFGVNVNNRSEGNLTPLHLAINAKENSVRQLQTVKYLLDAPGIFCRRFFN